MASLFWIVIMLPVNNVVHPIGARSDFPSFHALNIKAKKIAAQTTAMINK